MCFPSLLRECLFKLRIIQLIVEAFLLDQFVVRTLFYHIAIAHDKDQICVSDGG